MKKIILALILVLYANVGDTSTIQPTKSLPVFHSENIVFVHAYTSAFSGRTIYTRSNTSDFHESRLIENLKEAIAQK